MVPPLPIGGIFAREGQQVPLQVLIPPGFMFCIRLQSPQAASPGVREGFVQGRLIFGELFNDLQVRPILCIDRGTRVSRRSGVSERYSKRLFQSAMQNFRGRAMFVL